MTEFSVNPTNPDAILRYYLRPEFSVETASEDGLVCMHTYGQPPKGFAGG